MEKMPIRGGTIGHRPPRGHSPKTEGRERAGGGAGGVAVGEVDVEEKKAYEEEE